MSPHLHRAAPVLALLLAPATVLAHPGHPADHLVAGVLHPLSGLDHALMVMAVGAWAALLPAKGRVLIAACLAVFVGLGAALPPASGAALEVAIALTVVGAGMLLALGRRLPLAISAGLAASFAFIHGLAHGSEGPGSTYAYIAGLCLATGLAAWLVSVLVARVNAASLWWRAAGAVGAACGAFALTH